MFVVMVMFVVVVGVVVVVSRSCVCPSVFVSVCGEWCGVW